MLKYFRLKNRLLISFFLVTCISGTATTVFAIHYFAGKIEAEARETLYKHMQVAELLFQNRIQAIQHEGESLANDSTLRLLLGIDARSRLELYLNQLTSSSGLHELLLVDLHHKILGRGSRPGLEAIQYDERLHNELITHALRVKGAVSASEKVIVGGQPQLVISAAIPVEQSRQIRTADGAVVGDQPYSAVLLVRQLLTGNTQVTAEISQLLGIDAAIAHDQRITSSSEREMSVSSEAYRYLLGGRDRRLEQVDIWSGQPLAHYRPILDLFGNPIAVLKISTDATPFTDTIRVAVLTLSIVMLLCILVAFFIGYLLSRSILIPVEKLMNGVNRVTSGDLAYEIKLELNDELGHLATSFNGMARELNGLFNTLESRVLKATKDLQDTLGYLDAIIDNMADGLVVSDPEGRITRYNPAFLRMVPHLADLRKYRYRELLEGQLPKPPDAEERAMVSAREAEVNLPAERIAKAVATSIFQRNPKGEFPEYLGSVTLLRDITREKEMDAMLKSTVDTLTLVGTSLSSETNIDRLLELFVEEACRVCNADGGTLYTVRDGSLHFEIIRNKSMGIRVGGTSQVTVAISPLALDEGSIAGFVATRQQVVYVPNVAESRDFDFSNVRRYDASTGYSTRAMLVVPMLGRNNDTIGVLQLINPLDKEGKEVVPLSKNQTDIIYSFASQAAVALENVRSHEKIARKNIAFERFVPTEFLRILGKNEAEEIVLGDASQQFMSVLFLDIRAFTDRSERMSAEQNFLFLNRYLNAVGPGIVAHHGFIDKYIGDAIMALFPGTRYGVADDAMAAAVEILQRIEQLNQELTRQGESPVAIGIGIHTGDLTLGTIGFEGRMETTVIGDTVNLASRMEGLTKQYGICIAVSDATHSQLHHPENFKVREIDTVMVKGKAKPTRIFELYNHESEALRDAKQRTAELFQQALCCYKQGQWEEAIHHFTALATEAPEDSIVALYLERCRLLRQAPICGEPWDGITRLLEK